MIGAKKDVRSTITTGDPLDAVDGTPTVSAVTTGVLRAHTLHCRAAHRTSRAHASVSGHGVDGVQPRSDARPALHGGRGLDSTHETHATPDRFER